MLYNRKEERNMSDILYTYHGQLYVNLTNRCPCACTFCVCSQTRSVGSAEDLWLEHEPSVEEVKQALENYCFTSSTLGSCSSHKSSAEPTDLV